MPPNPELERERRVVREAIRRTWGDAIADAAPLKHVDEATDPEKQEAAQAMARARRYEQSVMLTALDDD